MTYRNLKKLREFRNYTQEYMAHALGKSQNTYSKMENGLQKIREENIIQLANILEVTPEILMSNEPILVQISDSKSSATNDDIQDFHPERNEIIEFLKAQILKKDEQIGRLLVSINHLSGKLQL